jgi:hypothetical protein
MTYKAAVLVDDDVVRATIETARSAGKLMVGQYRRAMQPVRRNLLGDLRAAPPPLSDVNYPLRWKSERQRRYVMAKLRRENNLPYQRTGELVDGWEVTIRADPSEGALLVENDTPHARYVQGDDAQPMHLDNGWPQAALLITEYDEIATNALIDAWLLVVDPENL